MPTAAKPSPYEPLVGLTGIGESALLPTALMGAVIGILGPVPLRLYQRDGQGRWVLQQALNSGVPPASAKQLPDWLRPEQQAADQAVLQALAAGDAPPAKPHAWPIAQRFIQGALLTDAQPTAAAQVQIGALCAVYANQRRLLNRSERDPLTDLFNRQAFDQRLAKLFASEGRWARRGDDLRSDNCLALIDIDHFKTINDRFGHLLGDEVLTLFGRWLRESFRDSDWLFRYGGEEFVVVARGVDRDLGTMIFERFRRTLAARDVPQVGQVTASIGFTRIDFSLPMAEVVARADRALYAAKARGRNRCENFEVLSEQGELQALPISAEQVELFD